MSNLILLFILFFVLDLLIAAVRAALVHSRLPHLLGLHEQHPQAVDRAIQLIEDPRMRISLRLSAVLVHFILAGLGWILLLELFRLPSSAGLSALLLFVGALVILVLEFAIEGAILRQPETWALRLLRLGQLFDLIFRPLALLMARLLGPGVARSGQLAMMTDEELKTWAETDDADGSLEQGERKMIYSIFQFGETLCREVMVPRIDVFGLEVNTSLAEAFEAFAVSGHSRIPVYADTIDNVLGILYAKDLLKARLNPSDSDPIRKYLRPPYFVPETKKADELLREMQERRVHMAIVVDEYGGTAGIVTLEDIVEEIIGEIRDEYDQAEEQKVQEIGPDELSFVGWLSLDDVNELLGIHLTNDEADTLGGYIYGKLGRVPAGGEELELEGWILRMEQVSGRRIRRVRALRKQVQEPVEEPGDDAVT